MNEPCRDSFPEDAPLWNGLPPGDVIVRVDLVPWINAGCFEKGKPPPSPFVTLEDEETP